MASLCCLALQPFTSRGLLQRTIFSAVCKKFTSAVANSVAVLCHSNPILLPGATVILGSDPPKAPHENRVELYRPECPFNADGTLATWPVITGVPSAFEADTEGIQHKISDPDRATAVTRASQHGVKTGRTRLHQHNRRHIDRDLAAPTIRSRPQAAICCSY